MPVITRSGTSGAAWMPSTAVTVLKSFGPVSRSIVLSMRMSAGREANRWCGRVRVGGAKPLATLSSADRQSGVVGTILMMVISRRSFKLDRIWKSFIKALRYLSRYCIGLNHLGIRATARRASRVASSSALALGPASCHRQACRRRHPRPHWPAGSCVDIAGGGAA